MRAGSRLPRAYPGGVDDIWPVVAALLPSAAVCALFVVVVRKMISADRDERSAQARLEAEERLAARRRASEGDADKGADKA